MTKQIFEGLINKASMKVGDFANPMISVMRLDEAKAILNSYEQRYLNSYMVQHLKSLKEN